MKHDNRRAAEEPAPYQLAFCGLEHANEPWGYVDAILSSGLLDPKVHPGGSVPVRLCNRAKQSKGRASFVLDSFQIESLEVYLAEQKKVRAVLEESLNKDVAMVKRDKRYGGENLWRHVRILQLQLAPRLVPTKKQLLGMKKRWNISPRVILADSDRPDTRSSYSLTFRARWEEEHFLIAYFRDGEFVRMSRE
jgi:hypothetical protein